MKIYSIQMSEDGLNIEVYTNIKAIFNGISRLGYNPTSIVLVDKTTTRYILSDIDYNYNNLVKALRQSSKGGIIYERATINCENGCTLEIVEHHIVKG